MPRQDLDKGPVSVYTVILTRLEGLPLFVGSKGSAGSGPIYPAEVLWNWAVTCPPAGTGITVCETGWMNPVLQIILFDVRSVIGYEGKGSRCIYIQIYPMLHSQC